MAEGKVASLFVEFRATVNQFAADMRQMANEVRNFDRIVASSKGVSDLGHLGSTAVSEVIHDFGKLTSGISVANTYIGQMAKGLSDLGHLGSTAVNQVTSDLGRLTSGLNTANTFVRQTSSGVSDIGHLGSSGIQEIVGDLGGLTSGLNTANTFARQASTGISDLGHLGSAAVNQVSSDLGGLTSGISTANTYVRQAATGVSDLGHLASVSIGNAATITTTFSQRIQNASDEVRAFNRTFYPISQAAREVGVALSLGLTAPIIATGVYAAKTAIDFETAFSGVRKTVQASEEQFALLRNQLIQLSTQVPVTAVEFAKIAQVAGQLGVAPEAIANFSRTMAELGNATGITAENAAILLARFTNITGLPQDKIHNLGSTLVLLDHNFAATSEQIATFGLRLARTGTFVGLTDAQILAFSAALVDLGLTSEQGATAISRIFAEMAKSAATGGQRLEEFAKVAGTSGQQFAQLFKQDAAEAVVRFVEGLKRIKDEGGNVFITLDNLRLNNVRVRDTLLAAADGSDKFRVGLGLANSEFQKDAELTRTVNEAYKTTASQLKVLKQNIDAVAISLGETLLPTINDGIKLLKDFVDNGLKPTVQAFASLPKEVQHGIEGIALIGATLGPAILIADKLVAAIGRIKIAAEALTGIKIVGSFEGIVTLLTTPVAIPWWLTVGTFTALILELNKLKEGYDELIKLQRDAANSRVGAAQQTDINTQKLAQMGFDIPVGKSKEDLEALTHNIISSIGKTKELADAFKAFNTVRVPEHLGPTPEELEAQAKAALALAEAQHRFAEKFTDSLAPAIKLNEELSYLQTYFSNSDIINVYAKQIVEANEAQKAHGIEVTGATAKLYAQAKALETVRDRLKDITKEEPVPTIELPIPSELPGELGGLTSPIVGVALKGLDEAKKEIEDLDKAIHILSFLPVDQEIGLLGKFLDSAKESAKKFKIELPPLVQDFIDQKNVIDDNNKSIEDYKNTVENAVNSFGALSTSIDSTEASIAALKAQGANADTIIALIGDKITKMAQAAALLHRPLSDDAQALVQIINEIKENDGALDDWGKRWNRVAKQIGDDITNNIASAIVSLIDQTKTLGEALKGIGLGALKDFVRGAVHGLVQPLVDAFVTAMQAHPVIAAAVAIGLAIVGVIRSLGNTHLFANQFVQQTQNPFAESLSKTVDAVNALYAAGRQTYQGAIDAQAKIHDLWQGFLDDAQKFGQQGRKQATVAQQAIETLEPTIRRIFFTIQEQIDNLKPPSIKVTESVAAFASYHAALAALSPEHIAALQQEANSINDQIQAIQIQIAAQEYLGNSTEELNAQLKDLVYQWDDVQAALNPVIPNLYDFAEAVKAVSETIAPDKTQEFVDKVINATGGAANLEQALGILEDVHTPVAVIIDRLGSDIEQFVNALNLAGLPIPELIQKYYNLYEASKTAGNATNNISNNMPRIANSLSKLVGDAVDSLRNIAGGGDLSKGILDALTALLTGLPVHSNAPSTIDNITTAVDKVRAVTESILAKLTEIQTALVARPPAPASADLVSVGATNPAYGIVVPGPVVMQVQISIADNEHINNNFYFEDAISRADVRQKVIPEITEALANNTDSVKAKWTRILNGAWDGVVINKGE